MRVLVFVKAIEGGDKIGDPTPEALEAFAAMDRFTEELVQAGVFVAAAGLKNNDEAMAWARRAPMSGPSEIEIRPFYEAADLAEFVSPEELAAPREGERGKLGVA